MLREMKSNGHSRLLYLFHPSTTPSWPPEPSWVPRELGALFYLSPFFAPPAPPSPCTPLWLCRALQFLHPPSLGQLVPIL